MAIPLQRHSDIRIIHLYYVSQRDRRQIHTDPSHHPSATIPHLPLPPTVALCTDPSPTTSPIYYLNLTQSNRHIHTFTCRATDAMNRPQSQTTPLQKWSHSRECHVPGFNLTFHLLGLPYLQTIYTTSSPKRRWGCPVILYIGTPPDNVYCYVCTLVPTCAC